MIKHFRNELLLAATLFILLIFSGTITFHFSQNYSWIDAIYMTVITISTVGFREVNPLDSSGKIAIIFLILTSIIIYGYTITIITEYVVGKNIFKKLIDKRMKNKIKKFSKHVIIVGYGRTGKQAVKKLKIYNKKVVVIDIENHEKDNLIDDENIVFIKGDATKDDVLITAGIINADSLMTTMHTDADNLFVVLSARQMNKNLKIVSRTSNKKTAHKMKLAGANRTIMPEIIGGDYMASLLVTPDLVEFINALSMEDVNNKTNLEEIHYNDLPTKYQQKSIANLDLRKQTGCSIIGYKTNDNKYVINPSPDTILEKDSAIIVLGQPHQINKLNTLFRVY